MRERLTPIAQELGIGAILKKYPYEVSGGQKQRSAVARAIISNPRLLLADEPTGALDSKATDELLRLFDDVNRVGHTIIMVTHSVKAASHAGRVLFIGTARCSTSCTGERTPRSRCTSGITDTLTVLTTTDGERQ